METERKLHILKSKAEALSLTCNLANVYWSRVKMCFNIPLVLTSYAYTLLYFSTTHYIRLDTFVVLLRGSVLHLRRVHQWLEGEPSCD